MSFIEFVVDKSGCFYSCFFWIIMERFRVNIFGKNETPAQGELDKRIDPPTLFSVITTISCIVLYILMKTAEVLLFLAIYLDFGENSHDRGL